MNIGKKRSVSLFTRDGSPSGITEPLPVRVVLTIVALLFIVLFLVLPLASVFTLALGKGLTTYVASLTDPDARSAIRLTLIVASIAVPMNLLFGVTASWAIAKFEFRGKSLLISLIDLPFAVSPVIAGLIFVLMFGSRSVLAPWLDAQGIKILFAVPAIVLASIFVTFPFVARELIPVMTAAGNEEEEAALTLGAGGWRTFFTVTLPNVKWGLLYGVILCNARAMGEFGAVSVVSGHIRGETATMPLHVEILYNEYNFTAAFAVASLLAMLAIVTLIAKKCVEWKSSEHSAPGVDSARAASDRTGRM